MIRYFDSSTIQATMPENAGWVRNFHPAFSLFLAGLIASVGFLVWVIFWLAIAAAILKYSKPV